MSEQTDSTTTDPTSDAITEMDRIGWYGVTVANTYGPGDERMWEVRAQTSAEPDGSLSVLPYPSPGVQLGGPRNDIVVLRSYGDTPAEAVQAALVMAQTYPAPAVAS